MVNTAELDTSLSDAINHTHKRGIRPGNGLFEGTYGALAQSLLVLAVLWTFCWWLWKRKLLLKKPDVSSAGLVDGENLK